MKSEEKDPGRVPGTNLTILKYPHPALRADNAIVTEFNDELKQIAKEMFMLMYAADGVGLAAPQVGINKRFMVFNEDGEPHMTEKEMILVNPSIVVKGKETDLEEEACLSFPYIRGTSIMTVFV
jgi:peptide deformylase